MPLDAPPYVALVGDAEVFDAAAHARHDLDYRSLEIEHREEEAALLRLTVARGTALALGQRVFIAAAEGGVVGLVFAGRFMGPDGERAGTHEVLTFTAQPLDLEAHVTAALQPYKVSPHYDALFVRPGDEDAPDEVLDGQYRTVEVDRTSGAVSIVDGIDGDGLVEIGAEEIPERALSYVQTGVPYKDIRVTVEAAWTQQGTRTLDLSPALQAAVSPIKTYSWPALVLEGWPKPGDTLGEGRTGYTVVDATLEEVAHDIPTFPYVTKAFFTTVYFRGHAYRPRLTVEAEVRQRRTERASFRLPLNISHPTAQTKDVVLRTRDVSEPLDGVLPIGDALRSSFLTTDRGRAAWAHAAQVAVCLAEQSQRCIDVKVRLPGWRRRGLSPANGARVTAATLPGGVARGKVTSVRLTYAEDGHAVEVTIACAIGDGYSPSTVAGDLYVVDGYVADAYTADGGTTFAGSLVIEEPASAAEDPLADFLYRRPEDFVVSVSAVPGQRDQWDMMAGLVLRYSAEGIKTYMAEHRTDVVVELQPLAAEADAVAEATEMEFQPYARPGGISP